ncbi:MAG: RNA methyltransferase [Gammaproteobacteria bacterium]|nr:MAG: RNA methyltransferase [Gammaproteobacteria bacterium]
MITRNQAKRIRKLRTRKRREEGAFLVEGVRLAEDLIASRLEVELVVSSPTLAGTERGRHLLDAMNDRGLTRAEVTEAELEDLADTETPQGVLAVAGEPIRQLEAFAPGQRAAVLVLDRIVDPGNLGTLMRTAHALGVGWVLALPGTVDPWSAKAVRASAGSLFQLPVSREPWPEALSWLRGRDFAIFGADPGGDPVARGGGLAPHPRFALVLGNEPSGLSDEVRRDCDAEVAVRLPGRMDSLNVAIAGALLLDRMLAGSEP